MRHVSRLLSALCIALLVSACANQKAPAEAAVKAAQDAYAAIGADAQKYVPDQAKGVQDTLTAAQDALTKGDYAGALTQAQALPAKISDLGTAVATKKAELTKSWADLSAGLPKMVAAIQSRVTMLAAAKKLPAGLTKDTVANAQTGLASLTQGLTEATTAASSGDIAGALAKGNDLKGKATQIMTSLNMQVPKAAM